MSDETTSPQGATTPAPAAQPSSPAPAPEPGSPTAPEAGAETGGGEPSPPPLSKEEQDAQEKKDAEEASEAAKRLNERKLASRERYNQLRREAGDWERRALAAEQRLRDYTERTQERPDPAQYTDPVKYEQDERQYQAVDLRRRDAALEVQEMARQVAMTQVQAWMARCEEYAAEVPDFMQVTDQINNIPSTPEMAHAIMTDDDGPAIAYYLAKNRAIAQRIASLPPAQQGKEIGKIAGRLSAPAPKRVTQAPPPPSHVQGRSGSPTPDINKMSMEEYAKHRHAQLKGKGG